MHHSNRNSGGLHGPFLPDRHRKRASKRSCSDDLTFLERRVQGIDDEQFDEAAQSKEGSVENGGRVAVINQAAVAKKINPEASEFAQPPSRARRDQMRSRDPRSAM
jgi:hypothetical protein